MFRKTSRHLYRKTDYFKNMDTASIEISANNFTTCVLSSLRFYHQQDIQRILNIAWLLLLSTGWRIRFCLYRIFGSSSMYRSSSICYGKLAGSALKSRTSSFHSEARNRHSRATFHITADDTITCPTATCAS